MDGSRDVWGRRLIPDRVRRLLPILLLPLAACALDSPCLTDPFGDLCRYEKFKDDLPHSASAAVEAITAMQDPVVRTTAVELWLKQNPRVSPPEGVKLCDTLLEGEKQNCARKVNSPHLHRQ